MFTKRKDNLTNLERSVLNPNYGSVKRFLEESKYHLLPNGKVIKPVCRKNKCEISYIDESMFKPIRMGIPCKKTGDCPGPDALCGKEGFCTVGNK